MDTAMVAALAAMGGAVLGGSASILTMLVRSHEKGRGKLRRMRRRRGN
jgi:hypothetical protein